MLKSNSAYQKQLISADRYGHPQETSVAKLQTMVRASAPRPADIYGHLVGKTSNGRPVQAKATGRVTHLSVSADPHNAELRMRG
jgi:hypothetical protein